MVVPTMAPGGTTNFKMAVSFMTCSTYEISTYEPGLSVSLIAYVIGSLPTIGCGICRDMPLAAPSGI